MKTDKNPSSMIKTKFAIRFLHAIKKLNKTRPPSPSMANKHKRYHVIRAAACASMASAVGPRRAWSRAVLRNIRYRSLHHPMMNYRSRTSRFKRKNPRELYLGTCGQDDDLRGLVPGGEGMGLCRLLSETAHYIKCLRAQVQVMTNILDHYST